MPAPTAGLRAGVRVGRRVRVRVEAGRPRHPCRRNGNGGLTPKPQRRSSRLSHVSRSGSPHLRSAHAAGRAVRTTRRMPTATRSPRRWCGRRAARCRAAIRAGWVPGASVRRLAGRGVQRALHLCQRRLEPPEVSLGGGLDFLRRLAFPLDDPHLELVPPQTRRGGLICDCSHAACRFSSRRSVWSCATDAAAITSPTLAGHLDDGPLLRVIRGRRPGPRCVRSCAAAGESLDSVVWGWLPRGAACREVGVRRGR